MAIILAEIGEEEKRRLKGKLALDGESISGWLRRKVAEELGDVVSECPVVGGFDPGGGE